MNLADIQAAAGLRTPIRHQLFIGGRFVDAESGDTLASLSPHDNSVIAEVAMAARQTSTKRSPLRARRSRHGAAWLPPIAAASCSGSLISSRPRRGTGSPRVARHGPPLA